MQTLLTLLITALQLKVMLLGLPVEFQSQRDQIMPIVENAITFATNELAHPSVVSPTVPVTPSQTVPTQSVAVIASSTPVSIVGLKKEYRLYGAGCSQISFQLHVQYSDGTFGPYDVVKMITPDGQTTQSYAGTQADRTLNFSYIPKSVSTDEAVSFTSGNLNTATTIHIDPSPFVDANGNLIEEKINQAKQQGINIQIENGLCTTPVFDVR